MFVFYVKSSLTVWRWHHASWRQNSITLTLRGLWSVTFKRECGCCVFLFCTRFDDWFCYKKSHLVSLLLLLWLFSSYLNKPRKLLRKWPHMMMMFIFLSHETWKHMAVFHPHIIWPWFVMTASCILYMQIAARHVNRHPCQGPRRGASMLNYTSPNPPPHHQSNPSSANPATGLKQVRSRANRREPVLGSTSCPALPATTSSHICAHTSIRASVRMRVCHCLCSSTSVEFHLWIEFCYHVE